MLAGIYVVKVGARAFPLAIFAADRYYIDVHGANGFYLSFRGNATPRGLMLRTTG